MMLALLPDIFALAALLLLLERLRRRHPEQRFGFWLAGLLLVFCEQCARLLMTIPGPVGTAMHIVSLDAYTLAAAVFVWGAFPWPDVDPKRRFALLASAPPLLGFLTLYGLGVQNLVPYDICIAAGLLAGLLTVDRLQLSLLFLVPRTLVLGLMALSVHHHGLLFAAFLGLAYGYAVCAAAFYKSLPRESVGRAVIVFGFSIWSLCFLTHAWFVQHPALLPFAQEVWSLQTFAVTIGMLLVMFEQQVERNKHLALHDQLTGLPNRRLFEDRLRQATLQAQRTGQRVALLVLDLDGFKSVNDTLGHEAGDKLLCEISRAMRQVLRSYNTVARIGGDEFAIVAPDLVSYPNQARSAADAIAATVHGALAQPFHLGEQTFYPGCSIGCAIYPDDSTDIAELHRLADTRMYDQKRGKRVPVDVEIDEFEPAPAQ